MAEQATQTKVLINDSVRIMQFAAPRKVADGMVEHDILRLMPGANRVDSGLIDRHKADIEKAKVVSVMDRPITSMSERDAVRLVQQTIDVELLKAFSSSEKRKPVKDACAAQILECTKKVAREDN